MSKRLMLIILALIRARRSIVIGEGVVIAEGVVTDKRAQSLMA
jgi:hypothetical protein